jgi:hypothetical protein
VKKDDFNWNVDNPAILLRPRLWLAIFKDEAGDVVLRHQEDCSGQSGSGRDTFMVLPHEDADQIAATIASVVRQQKG